MQTYFQSKYRNSVIIIFNIKVYSPPLDPANPFYCKLIWYIETTYVSGKLGSGGGGEGHTSKLKMVMTLFFKYLTGNKFALIDVSMIRMRNKIKSKLIDCNNTSYGWFYGKQLHSKR